MTLFDIVHVKGGRSSFYELDEPMKHLFDEIEKHVKDALESKPAANK
jgi:hypothetical protein